MMSWTKTKVAAAVVAAAMLGTGTVLTVNYAGAQSPKAQDAPAAAKGDSPAADSAAAKSPGVPEKEEGGPVAGTFDDGAGDKESLATAPAVVVKTIPPAGTSGVDPKLTEIRVTYSKDMANGSWSWSTWDPESFPKTTGKPRYEADHRTCVLPVKLEPNKFYAIWLNSARFGNFKDTQGRPALPYLLVFKTK